MMLLQRLLYTQVRIGQPWPNSFLVFSCGLAADEQSLEPNSAQHKPYKLYVTA
jgi:hypothetical protein